MIKLTLLILIFSVFLFATDEEFCANDVTSGQNNPRLPYTGVIKAVVIYVKFSDDTFDKSPNTDEWLSSLTVFPPLPQAPLQPRFKVIIQTRA